MRTMHYREYYLRSIDYELSSYGYDRKTVGQVYEWPDEETHWTVWMLDSLGYALAELGTKKPDIRVVLRCWGQAKAYQDRARPSVAKSDCIIAIQNYLEDCLDPR